MTHLAIDPVTRVGGHLRIEVELDGGRVSDAWSSGTVFRGLESILVGRDARDAWLLAERICGLCSGTHALASVRAVENALGLTIPRNARLLRNILAGTQLVADHVVGFYRRHVPDWVDTEAALSADPVRTAAYLRAAGRTAATAASVTAGRHRIASSSAAGSAFVSTPYRGHPAYRLSPEASLAILLDQVDALDWQRTFARLQTLIGGKSPHPQAFLVGGMVTAPVWGGPSRGGAGEHPPLTPEESPGALSEAGLASMAELIGAARALVDQVYLPDIVALARAYPEWAALGVGIGNYLSFGEFPLDESVTPALYLRRGRLMDHDLVTVDGVYQEGVAEGVAHSWYADEGGEHGLVRPKDEVGEPAYAGPTPPYDSLAGFDRYSWIKAPRFEGQPVEVGPLARMLVSASDGQDDVRSALASALTAAGLRIEDMTSTLGRLVGRAVEAQLMVRRLAGWHDELVSNLAIGDLAVADVTRWDPADWPSHAEGWSLGESPRGAVGHWLSIRDGRIEHYQVVDATTWNASPRDLTGWRGAIETALPGTPIADPARPLEVLRTVHSFDPCAACAVHRFDPADVSSAVSVHVREVAR
ncbi:MAG TPA: nickel-dependent hydrogenase large subunit [Candidatus Dormibacteraeota bacterium]|nr:nickel-dependent hydrogenase large subunit [Candidatus Dormibacteraeota bacterium]